MKRVDLSFPEFMFIVGTRALLGVGIGLLVGGRLGKTRRRAVGATLAAAGAITTIPAALAIFGRRAGANSVTAVAA